MTALQVTTQDSLPRRAGRVLAYVACLAVAVGLVSLTKSRTVDAREPSRTEASGESAQGGSTRVELNGLGLGFRHDVREATESELTRQAQLACEAKGLRAVVLGGAVHCGEGAGADVDPTRVVAGEHSQVTGLPAGGTRDHSLARRAMARAGPPGNGTPPSGSKSTAAGAPWPSRVRSTTRCDRRAQTLALGCALQPI